MSPHTRRSNVLVVFFVAGLVFCLEPGRAEAQVGRRHGWYGLWLGLGSF